MAEVPFRSGWPSASSSTSPAPRLGDTATSLRRTHTNTNTRVAETPPPRLRASQPSTLPLQTTATNVTALAATTTPPRVLQQFVLPASGPNASHRKARHVAEAEEAERLQLQRGVVAGWISEIAAEGGVLPLAFSQATPSVASPLRAHPHSHTLRERGPVLPPLQSPQQGAMGTAALGRLVDKLNALRLAHDDSVDGEDHLTGHETASTQRGRHTVDVAAAPLVVAGALTAAHHLADLLDRAHRDRRGCDGTEGPLLRKIINALLPALYVPERTAGTGDAPPQVVRSPPTQTSASSSVTIGPAGVNERLVAAGLLPPEAATMQHYLSGDFIAADGPRELAVVALARTGAALSQRLRELQQLSTGQRRAQDTLAATARNWQRDGVIRFVFNAWRRLTRRQSKLCAATGAFVHRTANRDVLQTHFYAWRFATKSENFRRVELQLRTVLGEVHQEGSTARVALEETRENLEEAKLLAARLKHDREKWALVDRVRLQEVARNGVAFGRTWRRVARRLLAFVRDLNETAMLGNGFSRTGNGDLTALVMGTSPDGGRERERSERPGLGFEGSMVCARSLIEQASSIRLPPAQGEAAAKGTDSAVPATDGTWRRHCDALWLAPRTTGLWDLATTHRHSVSVNAAQSLVLGASKRSLGHDSRRPTVQAAQASFVSASSRVPAPLAAEVAVRVILQDWALPLLRRVTADVLGNSDATHSGHGHSSHGGGRRAPWCGHCRDTAAQAGSLLQRVRSRWSSFGGTDLSDGRALLALLFALIWRETHQPADDHDGSSNEGTNDDSDASDDDAVTSSSYSTRPSSAADSEASSAPSCATAGEVFEACTRRASRRHSSVCQSRRVTDARRYAMLAELAAAVDAVRAMTQDALDQSFGNTSRAGHSSLFAGHRRGRCARCGSNHAAAALLAFLDDAHCAREHLLETLQLQRQGSTATGPAPLPSSLPPGADPQHAAAVMLALHESRLKPSEAAAIGARRRFAVALRVLGGMRLRLPIFEQPAPGSGGKGASCPPAYLTAGPLLAGNADYGFLLFYTLWTHYYAPEAPRVLLPPGWNPDTQGLGTTGAEDDEENDDGDTATEVTLVDQALATYSLQYRAWTVHRAVLQHHALFVAASIAAAAASSASKAGGGNARRGTFVSPLAPNAGAVGSPASALTAVPYVPPPYAASALTKGIALESNRAALRAVSAMALVDLSRDLDGGPPASPTSPAGTRSRSLGLSISTTGGASTSSFAPQSTIMAAVLKAFRAAAAATLTFRTVVESQHATQQKGRSHRSQRAANASAKAGSPSPHCDILLELAAAVGSDSISPLSVGAAVEDALLGCGWPALVMDAVTAAREPFYREMDEANGGGQWLVDACALPPRYHHHRIYVPPPPDADFRAANSSESPNANAPLYMGTAADNSAGDAPPDRSRRGAGEANILSEVKIASTRSLATQPKVSLLRSPLEDATEPEALSPEEAKAITDMDDHYNEAEDAQRRRLETIATHMVALQQAVLRRLHTVFTSAQIAQVVAFAEAEWAPAARSHFEAEGLPGTSPAMRTVATTLLACAPMPAKTRSQAQLNRGDKVRRKIGDQGPASFGGGGTAPPASAQETHRDRREAQLALLQQATHEALGTALAAVEVYRHCENIAFALFYEQVHTATVTTVAELRVDIEDWFTRLSTSAAPFAPCATTQPAASPQGAAAGSTNSTAVTNANPVLLDALQSALSSGGDTQKSPRTALQGLSTEPSQAAVTIKGPDGDPQSVAVPARGRKARAAKASRGWVPLALAANIEGVNHFLSEHAVPPSVATALELVAPAAGVPFDVLCTALADAGLISDGSPADLPVVPERAFASPPSLFSHAAKATFAAQQLRAAASSGRLGRGDGDAPAALQYPAPLTKETLWAVFECLGAEAAAATPDPHANSTALPPPPAAPSQPHTLALRGLLGFLVAIAVVRHGPLAGTPWFAIPRASNGSRRQSVVSRSASRRSSSITVTPAETALTLSAMQKPATGQDADAALPAAETVAVALRSLLAEHVIPRVGLGHHQPVPRAGALAAANPALLRELRLSIPMQYVWDATVVVVTVRPPAPEGSDGGKGGLAEMLSGTRGPQRAVAAATPLQQIPMTARTLVTAALFLPALLGPCPLVPSTQPLGDDGGAVKASGASPAVGPPLLSIARVLRTLHWAGIGVSTPATLAAFDFNRYYWAVVPLAGLVRIITAIAGGACGGEAGAWEAEGYGAFAAAHRLATPAGPLRGLHAHTTHEQSASASFDGGLSSTTATTKVPRRGLVYASLPPLLVTPPDGESTPHRLCSVAGVCCMAGEDFTAEAPVCPHRRDTRISHDDLRHVLEVLSMSADVLRGANLVLLRAGAASSSRLQSPSTPAALSDAALATAPDETAAVLLPLHERVQRVLRAIHLHGERWRTRHPLAAAAAAIQAKTTTV